MNNDDLHKEIYGRFRDAVEDMHHGYRENDYARYIVAAEEALAQLRALVELEKGVSKSTMYKGQSTNQEG